MTLGRAWKAALLIIPIGLVIATVGWNAERLAVDAPSFVEGTATVMRIRAQTSRRRRELVSRYVPEIVCEFHVGGIVHRGNRYRIDPPRFDTEGQALSHARTAGYEVGAEVQVYYDPADPSRSILARDVTLGRHATNWFAVVVGYGAAAGGVLWIGRLSFSPAYRDRPRRNATCESSS